MITLKTKSLFGLVTGLVIALSLVIGAGTASALTASDIDLLVAMGIVSADKAAAAKAALVTTTYSTLKIGSTGAEVSALQNMLISGGYLVMPAGVKTGYYGSLTAAAFAKYQAAQVVTPVTPGTPSGSLEGTDGSISDVSKLSQYSNEEVGEGQTGIKVLGIDVDTSKDGDIALKSIKVKFTSTGGSGESTKLVDYVDSVSVYMGSNKIGSVDASDFNKDSTGVYSKTISLTNATIEADKTAKVYLEVDAASGFDSTDISGADFNVEIVNIRYVDGGGVTTTDSDTGNIASNGTRVAVNFVDFSTSADTELKISKDSSSPTEGIVLVDVDNNTDDVVLLKGKIKVEGKSDVLFNDFPVTLTTTADGLDHIVSSLKLVIDGEEYTESVNSTGVTATTTFNDLDLTVNAGDTISFTVFADVLDTSAEFVVGDTLKAEVTLTNRVAMDVENSEGDQLSSSEKTGSATGLAQAFYTEGIAATFVSSRVTTDTVRDAGTASSSDVKTFSVTFNVKAIGDDVWVDKSAVASSSPVTAGAGTAWATTTNSTGKTNAGSVIVTASGSTVDDETASWKINSGETRTFTIGVTLTAAQMSAGAGSTAVELKGINWTTDSAKGAAGTAENFYTFNLSDFKTDISSGYMSQTN